MYCLIYFYWTFKVRYYPGCEYISRVREVYTRGTRGSISGVRGDQYLGYEGINIWGTYAFSGYENTPENRGGMVFLVLYVYEICLYKTLYYDGIKPITMTSLTPLL